MSGWQGTFREGQTWASLDSQLGANSPGGVGGRPREVLCVACSLTLRSLLKGQPVPKKAFPDPRSRPGRPRVCQDHRTDPSGTQVHLPTGPTAAPCPSLPAPPRSPRRAPGPWHSRAQSRTPAEGRGAATPGRAEQNLVSKASSLAVKRNTTGAQTNRAQGENDVFPSDRRKN